jgi:hypothetical protein
MVAITNAVSLTFLKDELENTLNMAGTRLEQFPQPDANREDIISTCQQAFHQVHGICRMLDLPAASMLAEEMELMVQELKVDADSSVALSVLGNAIVLLERYLDYIQIKNRELPELILDGLNELRHQSGKAPIPESHFFSVNLNCERYPETRMANVSSSDKPRLIRRMRHMYQVGLLGVLRDQNPHVNLKLMARALERMDRLCASGHMSRLIWLARGAVSALLLDNMKITTARKALLGQFDRQMKRLVYDTATGEQASVPLLLVKNSVYLVSLATSKSGVLGEIKQAFDLRNTISDKELAQERAVMSSGSSVIRTVANALKEELEKIKTALDFLSQGAADINYDDIADGLLRIANTLTMVGHAQESGQIKQQAATASSWNRHPVDPESIEFQQFVDQLLIVENAVTLLEKRIIPQDDVRKEANNESISLYQLDDARMKVVGECRSALSLTKRAISTYAEGHDPMHLSNLPGILGGAAGGLVFLDLPRARAALDSCRQYIERGLLAPDTEPATDEQMETLADALTSIDYYLESMEEQKPIGESVLEVAEFSMEELGFPVMHGA